MASLEERLYVVDVANEHHRRRGVEGAAAAHEGSGRHVVLHDLNAVVILEVDAGHLIEGHHVPQAHQADLSARQVVKEVSHRGVPT